MKIWSMTFGCKVNQYETELIREHWMKEGDILVERPAEADVCLINSCTVTHHADKECRQMIRRVLKENPHARTIVTGCYATRVPNEIRSISKHLEVYTNQEKDQLPSCFGYEVRSHPMRVRELAGHCRAFLKIQDGCKAPCAYCIIPKVRPVLWSKPVQEVITEMDALLQNGYQEIVLTGIRLGLYRGTMASGKTIDLAGLLKKLIILPGDFRIRLSSLEVTEVTEDLIKLIEETPKICRHFHIPLQSGDSEVLKAMHRWYDAIFYENRINAIRAVLPDCGLTADVMVGYPTETEVQFERTYDLIDRLNLSGLHVFRFSSRSGTEAAYLKPLDPRLVSNRAEKLGQLDRILKERFYRRFEGTLRRTLPEPNGEGWTDNYIRIESPPGGNSPRLVWMPVFNSDYAPDDRGIET